MTSAKQITEDIHKRLYVYQDIYHIPYNARKQELVIYMTYPLYQCLLADADIYPSVLKPYFNGYEVKFLLGNDYEFQIAHKLFANNYKEANNG